MFQETVVFKSYFNATFIELETEERSGLFLLFQANMVYL